MQEILLKIRYFERELSKYGQSYQKRKGPGTSDQLLFRSQIKLRKSPLLIIYYLSKFVDTVKPPNSGHPK